MVADRGDDRPGGLADASPVDVGSGTLEARGGAPSDVARPLSRSVCRRGEALRSGGAGQQSGRESQQPAPELLLSPPAAGEGLLVIAPVLPEPPPVPAE